MITDINERGLSREQQVKVNFLPEISLEDMNDYLKPLLQKSLGMSFICRQR